ncbi:hypothetical protein NEOLEDRAFT_1151838 [Neolentinus lepideus HHB14362 ss-1]|uniref:DUF659 domain-containing protein n=1 Tax=Neolentinus lepideus HHB14362 ss-1 TaxID=1314782 RepID=A0A165NH04_9AGAM|nr:hypothetical protein NEOLEDRAFT_1151838 [Neolentinus lepideus HHB14362 ss-1]
MRPKDPVWKYFDSDKSRYSATSAKNNHLMAWCLSCLSIRVEDMKQAAVERERGGYSVLARSDEELIVEARKQVNGIEGRPKTMRNHLINCANVAQSVKDWAKQQQTSKMTASKENITSIPSLPSCHAWCKPLLLRRTQCKPQDHVLQYATGLNRHRRGAGLEGQWTSEQQETFESDLCRLFIACGIAWSAADNPELHRFIATYLPLARVPDRRNLSGKVLNTEVAKAESAVKHEVHGKLASGHGDAWKTVSKVTCQASMITVEGTLHFIRVHDISSERKSAENLLKLVEDDIDNCKKDLGVEIVGWCTDSGGDCNKMRKLLTKKRPHILTPACWSHQMNLLVKDYFKLNASFVGTSDNALEVVKWFNNHSLALSKFRIEQLQPRDCTNDIHTLALIVPALTRWTYHYLSFTRLLTVQKSLRTCANEHHELLIECAGNRANLRTKAETILQFIEDHDGFWVDLARMKRHLEPLAIATNIFQSDTAQMDSVPLVLGYLWFLFDSEDIELSVHSHMHACLKARWAKVEQDCFIVAMVLNPYVRNKPFKSTNPALSPMALYNMAEKLYSRVFREPPGWEFWKAWMDYLAGHEEFSPEWMQLDKIRQRYIQENRQVDLVEVWKMFDSGSRQGWNTLVKLAIRVLTVVVNSAATERVFSELGLVITKVRNRLELDKAQKMSIVKSQIRRSHERAGSHSRQHLKRKFSIIDDDGSRALCARIERANLKKQDTAVVPEDPQESGSDPAIPLSRVLEQVSGEDDAPGVTCTASSTPGSPSADEVDGQSQHTGAELEPDNEAFGPFDKSCYQLKDLFRYDMDLALRNATLGFYWHGGASGTFK